MGLLESLQTLAKMKDSGSRAPALPVGALLDGPVVVLLCPHNIRPPLLQGRGGFQHVQEMWNGVRAPVQKALKTTVFS